MIALRQHFNLRSIKTKGLTLLIEHGPCCILSAAAGFIGVHGLAHNPMLELGFAVGGAFAGEYIGHRLFHKGHDHEKQGTAPWKGKVRRYALALTFGLASWGVHQQLFHKHDHDHDTCHGHDHTHVHAAVAAKPMLTKAWC